MLPVIGFSQIKLSAQWIWVALLFVVAWICLFIGVISLGAFAYAEQCLWIALSIFAIDLYLLVACILLARRRLQRLAHSYELVSEAHLDERAEVLIEDEIGRCAKAFNDVAREYQQLDRFLHSCVDETRFTAEELERTTTNIAEAAALQHQRLDSAAVATEEMSETVGNISNNVRDTLTVSTEAHETSQQGQASAESVVAEMRHVERAVTETEKVLVALAQRSQRIGEIVSTIDDITKQVNLLALNAAIEAARAGSAGQGFAVVANEVRSLAQHSADATGDISELVLTIQDEIEHAVSSIQQGSHQVDTSVSLVNDMRGVLQSINHGAMQTREMIESVVTGAEEHVSASQEMARAMEELSQLAEANQQRTQDTLEMVRYLRQLAEKLSGRSRLA